MSISEDELKVVLNRRKHRHEVQIYQTPQPKKKARTTPLSLFDLCDATARITKMLLALGAENNWDDVQESRGRSKEAGRYRENWLYLSRTDHGDFADCPKERKTNWLNAFRSGIQQTFFYYPSKTEFRTHKNYIERNAAAAVLSLTGSCDQHAFVLATLLRAILPKGTQINICGLRMGEKNFPHTFVVIGSLRQNSRVPLTDLPLDSLLAVDAWPTVGGAVLLKDFFVCDGAVRHGVLVVDKSYIADGKDHLIKRVSKQKILLDIIKAGDPDVVVEPSRYLTGATINSLEDEANYTQLIKRDKYLSEFPSDYEGMFCAPTISEKYVQSAKNIEAHAYICKNYPHEQFIRCLEYVEEQVGKIIAEDKNADGDFSHRLNTFA